jgi:hypothetical protein
VLDNKRISLKDVQYFLIKDDGTEEKINLGQPIEATITKADIDDAIKDIEPIELSYSGEIKLARQRSNSYMYDHIFFDPMYNEIAFMLNHIFKIVNIRNYATLEKMCEGLRKIDKVQQQKEKSRRTFI